MEGIKKPIKIERKKDLEKLAVGDVVNVTMGFPPCHTLVFEGVIDGKLAFMEKDDDSPVIHSIRQEEYTIPVDEIYSIMLTNVSQRVHVTYNPDHPEYETKKQLLIDAGLWSNI